MADGFAGEVDLRKMRLKELVPWIWQALAASSHLIPPASLQYFQVFCLPKTISTPFDRASIQHSLLESKHSGTYGIVRPFMSNAEDGFP